MKKRTNKKNQKNKPLFIVTLISFLIIILLLIYIIYLRFIPYATLEYDGYAVSGKEIATNLLNTNFDVDHNVKALQVKDQDSIYENLNSYYLGASKQDNINLNYPIYVNNSLALYNLSPKVTLITDEFQEIQGYSGTTLTSGELYNSNTLERADYYDYILLKNPDNLYINTKEIKIKTSSNEYTIKMNSIINFTKDFITYYSLKNDEFVYNKILDIDENSSVIIEDYNRTYTYKEFLMNLGIIKEENNNKNDNNQKEETKNEEKENKVENTTSTEKKEEVKKEETKEETEDNSQENKSESIDVEKVWIKPTVTCTDFSTNVYTAFANLSISDPSKVIYKAITFTFYKDNEIAFRVSSASSGEVSVTKLLPSTKYKIVGTFQYRNKEGSLIENTILEQEITTKGIDTLKPIDLSFENGQIYSNKLEIKDLKITSDINDEAIYGVSKAEILINDTKYPMTTNTLRKILKGESLTYQTTEGLKSNSKCDYEIRFYDTAGNIMNVKNNKGSTVTSKKSPSVKIKVAAQEVISVNIETTIINEDDVDIGNLRYILYSESGEEVSKGNITKNNILTFDDLNPQETYTIKIYADFDISDGKGMQYNQEIGNSTFSTLPLSKLGNLKLEVSYNIDEDLTCNSVNLTTAINTNKTDHRLIKILKSVNLSIQDEENNEIKSVEMNDISLLSTETGIKNLIEGLKSNTTYNIVITAKAMQGSKEESISTSYTLRKFLTNKMPAKFNISNVIVTTNLIDMDVYVDDVDKSCLEDVVNIRLCDSYNKEYIPNIEPNEIKNSSKIPTNQWVRLTYTGLTENETYNLNVEVASYNETNDVSKVQNNFQLSSTQFITSGLGGKIDLVGLERQMKEDGKNLVDAKSENNWYSKCFDSMNSSYSLDEAYTAKFNIEPKYNYGKTYTEDENSITLNLLSKQCYVYDLSKYVGQTVTISFSARVTEANAKVYIQKGKSIGNNIEQITGLNASDLTYYTKTLKVPDDGYVGFYLEKYEETIPPAEEYGETTVKEKDYNLIVKNLQIELGETATEYSKFSYDFLSNVNVEFLDEKHITFDENEQRCKYFVRLKSDKGLLEEYDYTYDSVEKIKENYKYHIEESKDEVKYTIELIIKQYGREYVLSFVEFSYNPADCTEIKSISNEEEFKEIQPYGNYILIDNIDLTDAQTKGEVTYGNPNISFYGSIDFNGKTIKKNTYSIEKNKEITSYIFYQLDESAKLSNIVIDYYINNNKNRYTTNVEGIDTFIVDEDGIYSLFLYNKAHIDNVIINLKESTEKQRSNVGLLGYRNSGQIENFVINFESTLYGSQYLAGVCLYSDGTIQNGYIYGKGIEAIGDITTGDYRYVAGVVFQVDGAGLMQNIYNIASLKMNHCNSTYSYGANMVYNVGYPPVINENTGTVISQKDSTAIVRNIYSVQPVVTIYNDYEYYGIMDSNNKEESIGPNILNKYTSTGVKESYYFCDVSYESNDYNTKSSATALYEPGVQEMMLNANNYSQFIIDLYVNNGYYPHLNLNYCMPKQENIRIDLTGTEIIDVLSGEVVKDNDISTLELTDKVKSELESYLYINNIDLKADNIFLAVFRVYNPAGTTISEINVNYMDTTIMSQSYSKKVSTVYCILNNPTSFLNSYEVASIRSKMANGKVKESLYGPNEDLGIRSIEVTFIKNISTAEEWNSINNNDQNGVSGLIQNYRLVSDIDFANADFAPYITGTFQGYLDGKYKGTIHTLKNINGAESLIKGFSKGTIKNLYIDGFTINSSAQKVGFIENAEVTENIVIDNIHIKDMEITSSYSGSTPCFGGIAGYINSGSSSLADSIKVQNCSVQGLNIEFTNTNVTNIRLGGLIGHLYIYGGVEAHVSNSLVQNLLMNANVTSNSGVGGIIGYKGHDTDEKVKPGTPYVYIENCYSTGKINTYNYAGGILGYGRYGYTYVNYCYSMVNITSKVTSGNAYIGGIVGYSDTAVQNITNNFYLGNIYVAGNNVGCVNRIFGGNGGTSSYKNYAYKDQLINGEIISSSLGTTKLLSYAEAFQQNTYTNLLGWGNRYAYKIIRNDEEFGLLENEYLPQLNSTEGNVLPNQKLTPIDNDLKLDSITSTPSSDKTKVTVVMKFENRNNLNLTRVKIENDDMRVIDGSWLTSKDSNGLTVVTFVATPNRAYDSYKIESIFYERNGQEIEKEITTKIKVELYKGISNAEEWNEFFSGEGRTSEGQNVKITGNIDFSTVSKIESNVVIGKLEADNMLTISNVNISSIGSYSGFIKEIKTSLKNITFENCNISGSANYAGIISMLRGAANNCKFNNIKIACNYDYIGIISRNVAGSFNNITLNNIVVSGRHFIGGLCGQATSLGSSSNIEGTYINITGTGDNVGGIFGYTDGTIKNLSTYQYSTDGKKDSDSETQYLVKGIQNVGGNIGQYVGGGNNATTLKTTNSIIQGSGQIGGNIGASSANVTDLTSTNNTIKGSGDSIGGNIGTHGYSIWNIKSTNNTITGNNNIGGNVGTCGWANENNMTSENNKVKGNSNVGGCTGTGNHYNSNINSLRSYGTEQEIIGTNYVGGTIGRSLGRTKNLKAEDCQVTGIGNYVGGVIGSSEYSTTSISGTNNDNYAIAGATAKNVTVTGNMNYVGGITGYQVGTMAGGAVEQSIITSNGSNVGGITGFYTGYVGNSAGSISSSNFFLWHSYCEDSTIKGLSNVGGIVGNFIYGNIQYCYVGNTSITAENRAAGGIVGYFDNKKLSNIQYKASIKYNFVANAEDDKIIVANDSVGGLIGMTAKQLNYNEDTEQYNNIECNLIVADIAGSGMYIDIGIGSVAGNERGTAQSKYMNNIYTYNCSRLNGVQIGGISEEKENYNMISSEELSQNIYTKNDKIIEKETDDEGNEYEKVVGNKGLNFGSSRYDYTNGYFPILKVNSPVYLYWESGNLNIVQNKIPIPKRTVEFTDDTTSLNEIGVSTMSIDLLQSEELPDVFVYAVDIDKVNIEFRNENTNNKLKVTSKNGTIIGNTNIEEKIYTLQYDFKESLDITVYNSDYSYKKQIEPDEIKNLLSIVNDEYFYLSGNEICSNKRSMDGEFVNLYKDKALDKNGDIYNVSTNEKIGSVNETKLLNEQIPIEEKDIDNKKIKTYAHCSKIIQGDEKNSVYKDKQIFVKNGYLYAIDGKMNNKNGEVIIDTYNNKQYETVLGNDGVMYDLLTPIKYPSNFKNEDIIGMTNNIENDGNIVLVYYSNGKVYGFNYVTGEEVYDNNVKDEKVSLLSYIFDKFGTVNISYDINESDYIVSTELAKKLDKVSVDEATEKISKKDVEINTDKKSRNEEKSILSTTEESNAGSENETPKDIDNKYITTYDAATQSYVVYSTSELVKSDSQETKTENEKINQNQDLISYYTNLSTGTSKLKDTGMIIIISIVASIGVILVILYKRVNR